MQHGIERTGQNTMSIERMIARKDTEKNQNITTVVAGRAAMTALTITHTTTTIIITTSTGTAAVEALVAAAAAARATDIE